MIKISKSRKPSLMIKIWTHHHTMHVSYYTIFQQVESTMTISAKIWKPSLMIKIWTHRHTMHLSYTIFEQVESTMTIYLLRSESHLWGSKHQLIIKCDKEKLNEKPLSFYVVVLHSPNSCIGHLGPISQSSRSGL